MPSDKKQKQKEAQLDAIDKMEAPKTLPRATGVEAELKEIEALSPLSKASKLNQLRVKYKDDPEALKKLKGGVTTKTKIPMKESVEHYFNAQGESKTRPIRK